MKITLRKFLPEDLDSLLSLFHDTVHFVNSKDYPTEQIDAWAPEKADIIKWKSRFKASDTIVAERKSMILGFANLEGEPRSIGLLYVHKDHQAKGIGTKLLRALERQLSKRGIKGSIVESSISAKPFFESQGYNVTAENRKMLNGIEFLTFIMKKTLILKKNTMKSEMKKKKGFRWRDLFLNKIFDLAIVIAGVSIAFQLNNLKLTSDQKDLEKFYLESMLNDLTKDIRMCERNLIDFRSDRKLVSGYLTKMEQPDIASDSLGIVVVAAIWFETFTGNSDTYSTLLATNGFNALADQTTRNQITEYYKQYQSLQRFDVVYTELAFQMYKYFSPYCDFAKRKIVDDSVVGRVETRNTLLMSLAQVEGSIENYDEMKDKAIALKKRIELSLHK